MIVDALGPCDRRCPSCAREFFRWVRGRMKNPLAIAGATSNIGPGPGEEHDPHVTYVVDRPEGRHWFDRTPLGIPERTFTIAAVPPQGPITLHLLTRNANGTSEMAHVGDLDLNERGDIKEMSVEESAERLRLAILEHFSRPEG